MFDGVQFLFHTSVSWSGSSDRTSLILFDRHCAAPIPVSEYSRYCWVSWSDPKSHLIKISIGSQTQLFVGSYHYWYHASTTSSCLGLALQPLPVKATGKHLPVPVEDESSDTSMIPSPSFLPELLSFHHHSMHHIQMCISVSGGSSDVP